LFGSTLVVKIKKTQESTPRFLKRITEDKENITLLPVDSPLSSRDQGEGPGASQIYYQ